MEPVMLIHGGAEDVPEEMIPCKTKGVRKACNIGYRILSQCGGNAVDAVEAAICYLEEDEVFNAGRGSSLNEEGDIEMDAAIMLGEDLSTGGVTVVKELLHPISLARLVMEKTPHVLLAGEGADKFACDCGVPRIANCQLITEWAKTDLEGFKKSQRITCCDSVGAVAMDRTGHIVAGSSTGGSTGRMVGRSSDSSKCGCGIYADDRLGGVAATGHGESIVKLCLAYNIVSQLQCGSPQQAVQNGVNEIEDRFCKPAGAIVLSKCGNVGVFFTSHRMPWAYTKGKKMYYGAKPGELNVSDCIC